MHTPAKGSPDRNRIISTSPTLAPSSLLSEKSRVRFEVGSRIASWLLVQAFNGSGHIDFADLPGAGNVLICVGAARGTCQQMVNGDLRRLLQYLLESLGTFHGRSSWPPELRIGEAEGEDGVQFDSAKCPSLLNGTAFEKRTQRLNAMTASLAAQITPPSRLKSVSNQWTFHDSFLYKFLRSLYANSANRSKF